MKKVIIIIVALLTIACEIAAATCGPIKHAPRDELDSRLYQQYTKTGLHLNSFTAWSGEDFFVVGSIGKDQQFYAAIAETYWGESCRVTRRLLLYDKNNNLLGYYTGLSERPKIDDLISIAPPEKLFFDDEHYVWVPLKKAPIQGSDFIDMIKKSKAPILEKGLPDTVITQWIENTFEYGEKATWEVNDCGEGGDGRPAPACVESIIPHQSGYYLHLSIIVADTTGQKTTKPQTMMIYFRKADGYKTLDLINVKTISEAIRLYKTDLSLKSK